MLRQDSSYRKIGGEDFIQPHASSAAVRRQQRYRFTPTHRTNPRRRQSRWRLLLHTAQPQNRNQEEIARHNGNRRRLSGGNLPPHATPIASRPMLCLLVQHIPYFHPAYAPLQECAEHTPRRRQAVCAVRAAAAASRRCREGSRSVLARQLRRSFASAPPRPAV